MNEAQEAALKKGQEALRRSRREIIDVKNIVESSLQSFAKSVMAAALEGYETNELNLYYGRASIGVFSIGLVKYAPEKEIVKLEDKPAVKELLEKIGAEADEQVGAAIPVEVAKAKRGLARDNRRGGERSS